LLIGLTVALRVQTSRLASVKEEYATFQADVRAKGELAEKERIRKEAEYAKSIKTAVSGRADALKRLRDSTSSRRASLSPIAPAGSDLLCFSATEFDRAIEHYRGRVRGVVTEGDAAQIDAKSLLEAWPR